MHALLRGGDGCLGLVVVVVRPGSSNLSPSQALPSGVFGCSAFSFVLSVLSSSCALLAVGECLETTTNFAPSIIFPPFINLAFATIPFPLSGSFASRLGHFGVIC
jgi:hypothetical protein